MAARPVGPTFSALPHAILFDRRLSRDAVALYAILQAHWWQGGECWASHATLAAEARCSERQLRRYIGELRDAGWVTERLRGQGQGKAYGPSEPPTTGQPCPLEQDSDGPLNRTVMAACDPPNRTPVSTQQDSDGRLNRTPVSDRRRRNEKEPPEEEDTGRPVSAEKELFDYYRAKIQPKARVDAPEKIRARLKTFSVDELKRGIDNFSEDYWWSEKNSGQGAPWFFDSDKRSEKFLHMTPRKAPDANSGRQNGSGKRPVTNSTVDRITEVEF